MSIFSIIFKKDIEALGAAILESPDIINTVEDGESVLHLALTCNFIDSVSLLIINGSNVNAINSNGQTPLHYACEDNNFSICKLLLENGSDVFIEDKHGNTPLWTAVFNAKGTYNVVELLLQYKANPKSINKVNKSPIDFAKQINDSKLISLLEGEGV